MLPASVMAKNSINDPPDLFANSPLTPVSAKQPRARTAPTRINGGLGVDVCNADINPFFKETTAVDVNAFGGGGQGNGQDCETCHQPGWVGVLHPNSLRSGSSAATARPSSSEI